VKELAESTELNSFIVDLRIMKGVRFSNWHLKN